jgi:hypothetical protein
MTDHANNHQGCNQSCKTYCIIHYRGWIHCSYLKGQRVFIDE